MGGLREIVRSFDVPARTGTALEVTKGDLIRVIDLEGQQPVDFWAFNKEDVGEYLSVAHTKRALGKLIPGPGDAAYTNRRRPIVMLVEDNSPGQHDMEYPACDSTLYEQLGAKGHANCQDNLHKGLGERGVDLPFSAQPWNLFTNFVVNPDHTIKIKAPDTKPGDNLILRAEMDVFVVVSACPQDLNPTCGGRPTDIRVEVGR
ncbi:MAG: DUF1989 domain-containing protein [Alphaproteobacteria bacterium]